MESNQRNWHQHVSPFLELILKGVLEKSNPCNKGCSLGLWKHGFRHLLSQTVCDYQQITWPRCSDPRESLNTFVDVGTGVSVLLFPFHSREKIVLPCLIGWRRQMHSGAPSAIWYDALILGWCRCDPDQLRRNKPFQYLHLSVGAPCEPASIWQAEDRSHRGGVRNPSSAYWSREDYQALGS